MRTFTNIEGALCEHAEGAAVARDRPEFGIKCGNRESAQ